MSVADLIPTADRWTLRNSWQVMPSWQKGGTLGWALVADSPDGGDQPVLQLAFADRRTLKDWVISHEGTMIYGFGGRRHLIAAPVGGRKWDAKGELVREGRKTVTGSDDHRFALFIDRTKVGALGRTGSEFYWAGAGGDRLVARARAEELPDPPEPEVRDAPRIRGARNRIAAIFAESPAAPADRWMEQTSHMNGIWDVVEDGRTLLTVWPPGGAHSTQWSVVPQIETPPRPEAVFLAAYVVFAIAWPSAST